LADAHVSEGKGAIIVDDPVTSLDHQRIRRVANRFVAEAARGRQVIIFTHNLLFYQEVLRACADRDPQVPALPCLIQHSTDGFGLVSINDQPWIAKKVRERERALEKQLKSIPDRLAVDSEDLRRYAKQFYTDLRETWERAVEEVVLGGVVERFGSAVKTQSLKMVDIDDNDYRIIFFAMKRVRTLRTRSSKRETDRCPKQNADGIGPARTQRLYRSSQKEGPSCGRSPQRFGATTECEGRLIGYTLAERHKYASSTERS
jgi:excinuclease UvrABC ATPase subunit